MRSVQNKFLKGKLYLAPSFQVIEEAKMLKATGNLSSIDKSKFIEIEPYGFKYLTGPKSKSRNGFGTSGSVVFSFFFKESEMKGLLKDKYDITEMNMFKYSLLAEFTDGSTHFVLGLNINVEEYAESTDIIDTDFLRSFALSSDKSLIFVV